jgi:hypothetical protein
MEIFPIANKKKTKRDTERHTQRKGERRGKIERVGGERKKERDRDKNDINTSKVKWRKW